MRAVARGAREGTPVAEPMSVPTVRAVARGAREGTKGQKGQGDARPLQDLRSCGKLRSSLLAVQWQSRSIRVNSFYSWFPFYAKIAKMKIFLLTAFGGVLGRFLSRLHAFADFK